MSEEGDQENVVSLKLREEFALLDGDQCYWEIKQMEGRKAC